MTQENEERTCPAGSKILYFGDNNLSLLQFRPASNNNKYCSGHVRDSKKMRIIFF